MTTITTFLSKLSASSLHQIKRIHEWAAPRGVDCGWGVHNHQM
jgi:hypothetical protein